MQNVISDVLDTITNIEQCNQLWIGIIFNSNYFIRDDAKNFLFREMLVFYSNYRAPTICCRKGLVFSQIISVLLQQIKSITNRFITAVQHQKMPETIAQNALRIILQHYIDLKYLSFHGTSFRRLYFHW